MPQFLRMEAVVGVLVSTSTSVLTANSAGACTIIEASQELLKPVKNNYHSFFFQELLKPPRDYSNLSEIVGNWQNELITTTNKH